MRRLPTLKERYSQLIALPSVSSTQPSLDQSNEQVVGALFEWFETLGFTCEVVDVAPGKVNLIASIGQGANGLVLSGHTDTVPCDEDLWATNPFELTEDNDRWYGLGVIDMKGFFPLVLEALSALDLSKIKRPLMVVATCDEESSMAGAQRLVTLGRRLGRTTVIGEPTGLQPIRAHKGIMMERLSITGQSGHSSNPELGRNALDAMADCLVALKSLRREWKEQYRHDAFAIPHPTMNFGCIHGGDNPNRICGQCALDFDVRTVPGMKAEDVRIGLRKAITSICDEHEVSFSISPLIDSVPSFEESPEAAIIQKAVAITNQEADSVAFGTEAPYFQEISDEVIILGAGSIDVAHQPNEHLNLRDISAAVDCLRSLIYQHCFAEES